MSSKKCEAFRHCELSNQAEKCIKKRPAPENNLRWQTVYLSVCNDIKLCYVSFAAYNGCRGFILPFGGDYRALGQSADVSQSSFPPFLHSIFSIPHSIRSQVIFLFLTVIKEEKRKCKNKENSARITCTPVVARPEYSDISSDPYSPSSVLLPASTFLKGR